VPSVDSTEVGYRYPAVETIAKAVGMSERQTQRVIWDLVRRTRLFHHNRGGTYSAKWLLLR
jgi:hypothetical protein